MCISLRTIPTSYTWRGFFPPNVPASHVPHFAARVHSPHVHSCVPDLVNMDSNPASKYIPILLLNIYFLRCLITSATFIFKKISEVCRQLLVEQNIFRRSTKDYSSWTRLLFGTKTKYKTCVISCHYCLFCIKFVWFPAPNQVIIQYLSLYSFHKLQSRYTEHKRAHLSILAGS